MSWTAASWTEMNSHPAGEQLVGCVSLRGCGREVKPRGRLSNSRGFHQCSGTAMSANLVARPRRFEEHDHAASTHHYTS